MNIYLAILEEDGEPTCVLAAFHEYYQAVLYCRDRVERDLMFEKRWTEDDDEWYYEDDCLFIRICELM